MKTKKTFWLCFFSLLSVIPVTFAGKTELTTYYPSAYGEYINLKSTADSYFATASGNVAIGTTSALYARFRVVNSPTNISAAHFATSDYANGSTGSNFLIDFGALTGDTYTRLSAVSGGSTTWNNLILQSGGGNVGIGTTSPAYKLDVLGSHATDYMTRIKNSNTTNTAKGLIIDLGIANASRAATNRFIDFAGAGVVAGKIQGGASAVAFTTTAADFAEYFSADHERMPQPGELVEMDLSGARSVQKAAGDVSRVLVGVVSSSPAFVGNGPLCKAEDVDCEANHAKYNVLVALVGQVSVKVNTSRGPIAVGDPIAASETPGEGAKAIDSGHIVGYAQEALSEGSGTIKVLIRPQYYYNPKASS